MYTAIRHYRGNRELAGQLASRGDEVKKLIGEIQGFRAYYLLSTGDGTVSITVCDDQKGAEETNQAAASWLRENMPEAAGSAPEIIAGEVKLTL